MAAALDTGTGAILWTTPVPKGIAQGDTRDICARVEGALGKANRVVFGCSLNGLMLAKSAQSFDSGGGCQAGPSIADGDVYWGPRQCHGLPDTEEGLRLHGAVDEVTGGAPSTERTRRAGCDTYGAATLSIEVLH